MYLYSQYISLEVLRIITSAYGQPPGWNIKVAQAKKKKVRDSEVLKLDMEKGWHIKCISG